MNDDKDLSTYTDKMTIDEIASNDLDMVKDAIRNANRYNFGHDMKKALLFVRQCLDVTLRRLGMTSPRPPSNCVTPAAKARHAAKLDQEMTEKQIRIEHRNKYRGVDTWRCGIYIYQRDELVAFISDILTKRRTEVDPLTMKIGNESIGYMVVTNARLDETKRIYAMPSLLNVPTVGGVQ